MALDENIPIHKEEDFTAMRKAGALAASVLDYITPHVKVGVTTGHLDQLCHDYILKQGATPAPLGYRGYPKATCISVNHVVCHGIPSTKKKLSRGDIANIDVTVILDGWHGDSSRMYVAGGFEAASAKARKLIVCTYDCMMRGIEAVKPGAHLGDVGFAIQTFAETQGFSVVRDFVGHGLGRSFHAPPTVFHYGYLGEGLKLLPGMFFTIEPMINAGKAATKVLPDGWTAVTRDRSLSAQFEHSLAVTETGYEIFTNSQKEHRLPFYDIQM